MDRAYKTYERGPDFERARTQIATPFQYLDIALDTAIVNQKYDISGDFLYIDTAFDGVATIELNNEHSAPMAPFRVQQGFALAALFKSLKVSASAQVGKKIRIMYSTGERVVPALTGSLLVTGVVSTEEEPKQYGASYQSITALAANTPDTVFSAAANTGGAVLHCAGFLTIAASYNVSAGYLAKASAPSTTIDGDVLCSTTGTYNDTTNVNTWGRLDRDILIPAGKGVYFITPTAEVGAARNSLYTLL